MKFTKKVLLRLKKINKKLKPTQYNKLKRQKLRGLIKGNLDRPRLSIFRSNHNIYAQIIDDTKAKTLITCSTLERFIKLKNEKSNDCQASILMGRQLAKRSVKKSIKKIVFDRGVYLYHGRIQAVAEGAREGGLDF